MTHPITILGSGLAGYTVARELRKLNKEVALRIISADAGDFYSKPLLSNALASNKSAAQLAMKPAAKMAEELGAEILPHTRVEAIDTAQQLVCTDKGTFAYSQLVLAIGADPINLGLQGSGAADVLHVNDLADYAVFRERIAGKQKVLLLGAGLIGCEFANDLVAGGYQVEVVDLAAWPLGRLLPQEAAQHLQDRLESAGVRFHLGIKPESVERDGETLALTLSSGEKLTGDVVLSAVGLRPRTQLASAAGIATARGIVVDRHLRTNVNNVFALGDCAEVAGLVLPFVLPIMNAARALAATLNGAAATVVYPAMPVAVKTPACPLVVSPPAAGTTGTWQLEPSADGLVARFTNPDGDLLGFVLLGHATAQKQALTASLPAVLP